MSEDQSGVVTLKVRVTPEFREKIIETAKANNRSMNAEIVHRLEQSFFEEYYKEPMLSEFIKKDQPVSGMVANDPRERRRLAKIAAMAVMKALEDDQSEGENKAP